MGGEPIGIDSWIAVLAAAAGRLPALGAVEGAAGNMSLFLPDDTPGLAEYLTDRAPQVGDIDVTAAPSLPPGTLLITGTGRRLPELATSPDQVLCAIVFDADGSACLHSAASDVRPTSEVDSHLGVHAGVLAGSPRIHAVVHAQPPTLTWLSHIPAYQDENRMNRQLLRWQPETIVTLPEGIGVLPFITPGTATQGEMTAAAMVRRRLAVWAQHGVVSRSDRGPAAAVDLIDYVETVARYEHLDIAAGRPASGLSLGQLEQIARRFGVPTELLSRLPAELLPSTH